MAGFTKKEQPVAFGDYKVTKKFRLTLMVDDVKMSRLYTDKGTYGIDNTSWTIVE